MPSDPATAAPRALTRTKLAPDVRRAQFLDCAQALFFSAGYEATTVNDILARAGASKGAFYHYFDSKEALLDALAERVAAQVIADAGDILDDPSLDALSRLNAFLAQGRHWKIERAPMLRAMFDALLKSENVALNQRIVAASGKVVTPVLIAIVEEGAREGVFDPASAAMVAEIVLLMGAARMTATVEAMALAARGDLDAATARLESRMADEETVIERLLGVPRGSVQLTEPGFMRAMLAAMA
jgi:AcrR family transcriptional regulator